MSVVKASAAAGQAPDDLALGNEMLAVAKRLSDLGLNRGSTGNVSARNGDCWLVTPSGVPPEALSARAMVAMD
jgi:L-fuculose-phosphate aldolase